MPAPIMDLYADLKRAAEQLQDDPANPARQCTYTYCHHAAQLAENTILHAHEFTPGATL